MHKYLFLLEIIGIFIIILFQFGIYYRTRRSIRILKGIYPALKELKLKRLFIPESYASKINGFNLHRLISADKDDDDEDAPIEIDPLEPEDEDDPFDDFDDEDDFDDDFDDDDFDDEDEDEDDEEEDYFEDDDDF